MRPTSLHHVLDTWLPELRRHCPSVPVLLVGTQADLRTDLQVFRELSKQDDQPIWPERGQRWVKVLKLAAYAECSARTADGLKRVFDEAIWTAMKRRKAAKAMNKSHQHLDRLHSDALSQEDDERAVICRLLPFGGSARSSPQPQSHRPLRHCSSSSPSSESACSSASSSSASSSGKSRGMMKKITRMLSRGIGSSRSRSTS